MVGIVILNYNNSAQTLSCLETLYTTCPRNLYKVCVVDNASSESEVAKLRSGCSEHIIYSKENGGYARGNDLGLEYFEKDEEVDFLMVLNDDTRFTMDILTPMREYLVSHPDCGVVFPLVMASDGSIDKACARKQKTTFDLVLQATSLGKAGIRSREFLPTENLAGEDEVFTQVPPGSCMMLRKEVFAKLGYLDPGTFLYFEEHILSHKLEENNLKCVLLPKLNIIHLGAQTTRRQPSRTVYRHWRRSYLYFMKNYSEVPALLRALLWLRTLPRTLI